MRGNHGRTHAEQSQPSGAARQRDRRRGHAGRRRTRASDAPGTLAPDEVYGLVAWILAGNGIVARAAVMNAETLPAVEMPARGIFIPQER